MTKRKTGGAKVAKAKGKTQKVKPAIRKRRGINLLPSGEPVVPCRAGSKQAILVDMLSRKEGATMADLLAALSGGRQSWQEATVRSAFGWDLKLKGYGVRSRFGAAGAEHFHLVVPAGARVLRHIGATNGKTANEAKPPKVRGTRRASPQVAASRSA